MIDSLINKLVSGGLGWADAVILIFIIGSAIPCAFRGFVREALATLSWVVAIVLTFYLHPLAVAEVRAYTGEADLSLIAGTAGLFVVLLAASMIISIILARFLLRPVVGFIDRFFGIIFGLARGFVIVALALIVFVWWELGDVVPPKELADVGSQSYELRDVALLPLLTEVAQGIYVVGENIITGGSAGDIQSSVQNSSDKSVNAARQVGEAFSGAKK